MRGVVDAQGTIAAAVEEQSVATAQAREAIAGASREAASMAADLQRIGPGETVPVRTPGRGPAGSAGCYSRTTHTSAGPCGVLRTCTGSNRW
jgi:hypothetical protein